MGSVSTFLANFDLSNLIYYLMRGAAALLCIVIHEMSHGYAAYGLGDRTAKQAGRLSFNPIRHIDPLGLLLMITAGFGWAKPVPVDMRRFRNPKQGMALTALAGPASNFVLALLSLGCASLMYHFVTLTGGAADEVISWIFTFLLYTTLLSVGLGVFNLFPIPPLDGSKVVFSLLPNRAYVWLMRNERYITLVLFALVFLGALDGPLYTIRQTILAGMCRLMGMPLGIF